jgi:hypothetical protein
MGRGSPINWRAFFLHTELSIISKKILARILGAAKPLPKAMTVREPRLAGTNWKRFAPKKIQLSLNQTGFSSGNFIFQGYYLSK